MLLDALHRLGARLYGRECVDEVLSAGQHRTLALISRTCRQHILRRSLACAVVAGASVVRLPQIAKVLLARDARGLSLLGALLEASAGTVSFAYGWSTGRSWELYADAALVAAQSVLLMLLIGLFASGARGPSYAQQLRLSLALVLYAALCALLFLPGYLAPHHLLHLQMATIPAGVLARVPQIVAVLQSRSAGQLSVLSLLLGSLGSTARLYTTLHGARDDPILLAGAASSTLLSTLLLLLVLFYARSPPARPQPAAAMPTSRKPKPKPKRQ